MADQITGRDSWIIGEALAQALITLEQLPEDRQPHGNMEDMRRLLAVMQPRTTSILLAQAKCRLFPDLDPVAVYREYDILVDGDDEG
jgi:hypothetical protein